MRQPPVGRMVGPAIDPGGLDHLHGAHPLESPGEDGLTAEDFPAELRAGCIPEHTYREDVRSDGAAREQR